MKTPTSATVRRRSGTALVAALTFVGLGGATATTGAIAARARSHDISVTATPLRAGASGTLTTTLRVSTSGTSSDQLDAAIATGGATVAVYHQKVSVGELSDLAGCGGDRPPPDIVDYWLHYGPMLVPGRAGGSEQANATLTVRPVGTTPVPGSRMVVTLYFANAGALALDLPVVSS